MLIAYQLKCTVFQDVLSVADVVLWAALHPVLSDSSLPLGKNQKSPNHFCFLLTVFVHFCI